MGRKLTPTERKKALKRIDVLIKRFYRKKKLEKALKKSSKILK